MMFGVRNMHFVKFLIVLSFLSLHIMNANAEHNTAVPNGSAKNESLYLYNIAVQDDIQLDGWIFMLFHYIKIVYILVGIVNNSLIFGVFYKRNKERFTSANIYFMTLAVADGLACAMFSVLVFCYEVNINLEWMANCWMVSALYIIPSTLSTFVTTALCMDRVFAVFFPLKFKVYNSEGNGAKIIGITIVVLICDQWYQFGFLQAKPAHEVDMQATILDFTKYCDPRFHSISGYLEIRQVINMVWTLIIPSAIMIVSSLLTIWKVYAKHKTQVGVTENSLEMPTVSKKEDATMATKDHKPKNTLVNNSKFIIKLSLTIAVESLISNIFIGCFYILIAKNVIEMNHIVREVIFVVRVFHHFVKLYLYYVITPTFQKDFKKLYMRRNRVESV